MPIEQSRQPITAERFAAIARDLLDAAPLYAIATVSPGARAHVNSAYFAWSSELELVWLSARRARHSRNIHANPFAAIAVCDSNQSWGSPDRGIQLFGAAGEVDGAEGAGGRDALRHAVRDVPPDGSRRRPLLPLPPAPPQALRRARVRRRRLRHRDALTFGRPKWKRTEVYRAAVEPSPDA